MIYYSHRVKKRRIFQGVGVSGLGFLGVGLRGPEGGPRRSFWGGKREKKGQGVAPNGQGAGSRASFAV